MYYENALNIALHMKSNDIEKFVISSAIMESYIAEDVLQESLVDVVSGIFKPIMSILQGIGLDVQAMVQVSVQGVTDTISIIKNNGFGKKTVELIGKSLMNLWIQFGKTVQHTINYDYICKKANLNDSSKLRLAVTNYISYIFLVSIVNGVVTTAVPLIGNIVANNIIIPLIFEVYRILASKGGYIKEFTILSSIINIGAVGVNSFILQKARGIPFLVTFIPGAVSSLFSIFTNIIGSVYTWIFNNTEILKKAGINPKDKEKISIIANMTSIFLTVIPGIVVSNKQIKFVNSMMGDLMMGNITL